MAGNRLEADDAIFGESFGENTGNAAFENACVNDNFVVCDFIVAADKMDERNNMLFFVVEQSAFGIDA
jgi:protein-disulfide isomerase-like protein with CxxC motif